MSFAGVSKLQVFPLNQQAEYSFKNGNPIINFQIGRQMAVLDTNTLMLHFKLALKAPGSPTAKPDNNGNFSGSAAAAGTSVRLNERIGVWSVIDRIVISESSRNQTIESIRDVGRVMATIQPASFSGFEYNQELSTHYLCGTREAITANYLNQDLNVCVRLADVCGSLSGNASTMSLNLIPLNISIHLASDAQALIADSGGGSETTYKISDVFLTGDLLQPNAQLAAQMAKDDKLEYSYNTFSSIYNIQNSTNQTTSLQWGLSSVRSIFATVLPPSSMNNLAVDSFATPEVFVDNGVSGAGQANIAADIDRVSFLRGSQNFPVLNEFELLTQSKNKTDLKKDGSVVLGGTPGGLPLVPLLKHGLSSVGPHNTPTRTRATICDAHTQCGLITRLQGLSEIAGTQPKNLRILGMVMDEFTDAGLPFRDISQGIRLNLQLEGSEKTTPMGIHTTAIATNTLVVDKGVVSVLS